MQFSLREGLVAIKITESVCGFFAICMTVARLYFRRGNYWWDDAWAFFSFINLLIQIAGIFMHVDDPSVMSKTTRVAAYYIICITFYAVIWSARLSILFSIIRVHPDALWIRRLKMLGGIYFSALVFFWAQLFWVCEPQPGWKDEPSPQCELGKQVAICQLVSDILADLILVALPIFLVRRLRDTALRRRVLIIFSTSIVTSIVSLVHAAFIISGGGFNELISALVEDCMSLLVANAPVVVAKLLRHVHPNTAGEISEEATQRRFTSIHFRSLIPNTLRSTRLGDDDTGTKGTRFVLSLRGAGGNLDTMTNTNTTEDPVDATASKKLDGVAEEP